MIFLFTGCPDNTEPKVEWFDAEFAMDANDKRAVVGSVDCTFVGIVERQLRTEQRTIGKTSPDTIPFTIYDVKVLKNIKGELPKDELSR